MSNKCVIAEKVTKHFVENNITISFMESCTSGLLASMFTDTEGASAVFKGSYITYSNEMKMKNGVDADIIEKYGVYSPKAAQAMAETVKKIMGTDVAIGITGTTGNVDPENPDSIEGEAYYCIIIGDEAYSFAIKTDVKGMNRKETKQFYADNVYGSLAELLSLKKDC